MTVSILSFFSVIEYSEGHKIIDTQNNNNNFEESLSIPNHTISWAIYQQLGGGEGDVKFYKFQNEQINSNLYVQLTIPTIEEYKTFTPVLALLEPLFQKNDNASLNTISENYIYYKNNNNSLTFEIPKNYRILLKDEYQGPIPSPIFYEPFTQTSYWERQEIRTQLKNIGTYYIVVFNENNASRTEGKFVLAVGDVEDFSLLDFFVLIPYSWIKLKLFFNDYLSLLGIIIIFIFIILIFLIIFKTKKHKNSLGV